MTSDHADAFSSNGAIPFSARPRCERFHTKGVTLVTPGIVVCLYDHGLPGSAALQKAMTGISMSLGQGLQIQRNHDTITNVLVRCMHFSFVEALRVPRVDDDGT
jgi:hypothetical protein